MEYSKCIIYLYSLLEMFSNTITSIDETIYSFYLIIILVN